MRFYVIDVCGSKHWEEKPQSNGAIDVYEINKDWAERVLNKNGVRTTLELLSKVEEKYDKKQTIWLDEEEQKAAERGNWKGIPQVKPQDLSVFV